MTMRRVLFAAAVLCAAGAPVLRAQADLRAIWGSGPADIWVVGDRPAAVHFDGQNWNEVPFGVSLSGDLNAVWGSGPRDLFAVGENGMVLHYDGARWTRQAVPTTHELVAVAGRTATEVYALAQSESDREAPLLLRYDGRTWTATALPMPFRAGGLAFSGADIVVTGFVYQDPTPDQRRQVGVLARLSGGRWATTGWDGQRVTDPVLGGAGWTGLAVAGPTLLVWGERDDGTPAMAQFAGGNWTSLPPAASVMSGTRVNRVFLAGDGVPVALYDGPGFARYQGGRWVAVAPMANMQQMMMQQMMQQRPGQPAAPTPQQMQQAQMMQQMMANPMMMAARMAGFDMSDARSAWGASAQDFYVSTSSGRVTHVTGDDATVVYDASCGDPMSAGMNPICQMLQMQQNR